MFKNGERQFYVGWSEFARKLYKIMQTDVKDVESKLILESLQHSTVDPGNYWCKVNFQISVIKYNKKPFIFIFLVSRRSRLDPFNTDVCIVPAYLQDHIGKK